MVRNEFLPFRYRPYITGKVVAFVDPNAISYDSDATHCVLCQETYKWFKKNGCRVVHISDFVEVPSPIRNDLLTLIARAMLRPLLPVLRHMPLIRWFVIRFPMIVEKKVKTNSTVLRKKR